MKLLIALVQASGEDMILSAIQLLRVALVTRLLLLLIALMIIATLVTLITLIVQRRKGKPPQRGGMPNPNPDRLSYLLNQPCPKHGTKEVPANHLWKDCFIMQEFKVQTSVDNGARPVQQS